MAAIQHPWFDPDEPSGWTDDDFARFVKEQRWIVALKMADNPHEYTLRRNAKSKDFRAAVRFIRERGHLEEFRGTPYKILYFNEHKYWTMGAPLGETILINRKPARQH